MSPATIAKRGPFDFDEDGAAVFVDLLEQLYYETDFTGEHRRADRYSLLSRGGAGHGKPRVQRQSALGNVSGERFAPSHRGAHAAPQSTRSQALS